MFELFSDKKQIVPIKIWRGGIYEVEHGCIEQAINASNHPAVFSHVVLAPDCHQGYGLPVGGVACFEDVVSPNCVGVDIACGMLAFKTNVKVSDLTTQQLEQIVAKIKHDIPMGPSHQKTDRWSQVAEHMVLEYHKTCKKDHLNVNPNITPSAVYAQLGTLGGGNHFIEIQKDTDDNVWIMVHSGSRNLGHRVATYYHKLAKELCNKWKVQLPHMDLAYLPTNTVEGKSYLNDMRFCETFSFQNRICMLRDILYAFSNYVEEAYPEHKIKQTSFTSGEMKVINIHHNYVALENHFGKNVWVHRKGATSAKVGELGIIPGSMGSTSYIVKGKGNIHSFMSCSHGAGRTMSRKQAKLTLSFDDFEEQMKDIVSVDVNENHLDESPMAYKPIQEVMELQKDLVSIVVELTPIANCKG